MTTINSRLYFFIGTEAELIKMVPVMKINIEKGINIKIIASGQNNIDNSKMLLFLGKDIDIYLTKKSVTQTPLGLLLWIIKSLTVGLSEFRKEFGFSRRKDTWLIVHGDTVSTVIGAILGRLYGLRIAHVEAGYKSSNLLNPFPEEIDRRIASFLSDTLFCPFDSIGVKREIDSRSKKSINIGYNTSIDTLNLALEYKRDPLILSQINKKYFIFALHRQETLVNTKKFVHIVRTIANLNTDLHCVFTIHSPTKKVLQDLDLLDELLKNNKVHMVDRIDYFEYVTLLYRSEFIMTDGVGNQQESFYLGKPCFLLRDITEGMEGIDSNAMLYANKIENIEYFVKNYVNFQRNRIQCTTSPSSIISEYLLSH